MAPAVFGRSEAVSRVVAPVEEHGRPPPAAVGVGRIREAVATLALLVNN